MARDNRDIGRLMLALACSTVGYWGYTVAVLVFAYDRGGTSLVGVAAFVRLFPAALASPFAGAVADRYPRRSVLIGGDLLRMATLVGVSIAAATGAPTAVVLTLVAINAALYSSFRPAMRALTPGLARTPEELTAANIMSSTVESVGMLAGPAIGGALLAATSPSVVFAGAAGALGASALLVTAIARQPTDDAGPLDEPVFAQIAAGARVIRESRPVALVLALTAGQTLSYGALSVLTVVLVSDVLDASDGWVGYINGLLGLGGVAGAVLVAPAIARRLTGGAAVGLLFWGLPLCLIGVWPERATAIVAVVIVGVANTLVDVSLNTMLQRLVVPEVLGRVFAMLGVVVTASIALGGLLAPALVSATSPSDAFVVAGLATPLLVLVTSGALRRLEPLVDAPAPLLPLLANVPVLFGVRPGALEQLARRAVDEHFEAGEFMVTEGDAGDRFYVIVSGTAEVTMAGRYVRTLGPGDAFGEIALLRNVPRTATVQASTPAQLVSLASTDFVPAVTASSVGRLQ